MTIKVRVKRNPIFRSVMRAIRSPGYRRMARAGGPPFNGDQILTRTVDFLLSECGVKQFIETGTHLGYTCRYFAARHPGLPFLTIENNPDFYDASQTVLRKYQNVKAVLGDSAQVISKLVQTGIHGLPFFFLDAHWYDYLPLPDEIAMIGNQVLDAVMVIHDFQVPSMNYVFDAYKGQSIGIGMLAASINKGKNYQIYFPNYTYERAYNVLPNPDRQLRGYAIVFQGASACAERFVASEHIRWYVRGDLQ